jgi:hypothetical protein
MLRRLAIGLVRHNPFPLISLLLQEGVAEALKGVVVRGDIGHLLAKQFLHLQTTHLRLVREGLVLQQPKEEILEAIRFLAHTHLLEAGEEAAKAQQQR